MKKTILIVDDNKLLRGSIRTLVENEGLTVCGEAADGVEAIQKAKRLKPDLVLLDLALPKLNGAMVASAIKQSLPEVVIVLFTIHADEARALASTVGFDVVLHKSDGLSHLAERVQARV